MNVIQTAIPDVLIVEPKVFADSRGFFYECFNRKVMEAAGIPGDFVQDNHSRSARGVLRGLHYQIKQPQGKLVWRSWAQYSTWPWISAGVRRLSASGWL